MRIKQQISFRWHIIWLIVGIALMVGFYSFVCYKQKQRNPKDTTVPNASQLIEGWKIAFSPQKNNLASLFDANVAQTTPPPIWTDSKATFGVLFKSLTFATLVAIIIGVLMGALTPVESMFHWPLNLLSCVPPTALLAVFLVLATLMHWSQQTMFIALVGFGVIPTLTKTIYLSVKNDLTEDDINQAYTLGASHDEVITTIIFPQILPKIIDGIRLSIGPAMVFLIAVEYYLGQEGFGYQLRMRARMLEMNVVYVYLFILACSGLFMTESLVFARNKVCPWFNLRRS